MKINRLEAFRSALRSYLALISILCVGFVLAGCSCVIVLPSARDNKVPTDGKNLETCQLEVKPSLLHYGSTLKGKSYFKKVTVTNLGEQSCMIDSLKIAPIEPAKHNAFTLIEPPFVPHELRSEQNMELTVRFIPTQKGLAYRGVLFIGQREQLPFRVELIGNVPETDCLEVHPKALDFSQVQMQCKAQEKIVHVQHNGNKFCPKSFRLESLSFSEKTSSEFSFKDKPLTPVFVTKEKPVVVTISYDAKDIGVDTGNLVIRTDLPKQREVIVPLKAKGVDAMNHKDTFRQLREPKIDILFVVDNSGSMGQEQKSLATNFQSFMQWASKMNADYHIGVVTTDTRRAPPGCLVSGNRSTPQIVTKSSRDPIRDFAINVRVGTRGSAVEKGLESAHLALSKPMIDQPSCNKGFMRPDASLSIIFLSDEPDQSSRSVDFYLDFFKGLKPKNKPHMVRASAIVGPEPSGCESPQGRARSGPRYLQIARKLNGVVGSICSSDWASTLSKLGMVSFGPQRRFYLSSPATPKSIRVTVDGKPAPEGGQTGWLFDDKTNSVVFPISNTPPQGSTIVISYQSPCK